MHEALRDVELQPGMNFFDGYMVHVSTTGEREEILRYILKEKENEKSDPDGASSADDQSG